MQQINTYIFFNFIFVMFFCLKTKITDRNMIYSKQYTTEGICFESSRAKYELEGEHMKNCNQ